MSDQQFGRYSLLRRLSQDAFGSVYRAGVVAGGGVAELVLLRTFDIPSSELDAVEAQLKQRPAGGGTPSLPNAVDKGVVDGTPFLVYRYASGRTMRDLMQETAKRGTNVPVEHCLFLVHRVCKAAETYARASDSSGIVFPETLYLSNDGDIQILARELGGQPITALAKSMGLSSYLAPEVRDANVQVNDDVFAVAALVREMLGDSTPDEVRELVDDGTATAADRMSLDLWEGKLEQLIYARPEQSSAFNVAFFLNGLLIDEIEEDARRIEAEKTALGDAAEDQDEPAEPAPEAQKQPEPAAKPAAATTATAASRSQTAGMPKPILLAAGLVVLALLGFLGWSMFQSDDPEADTEVVDQAVGETASPTFSDGVGPADTDVAAGDTGTQPGAGEADSTGTGAAAQPLTQPTATGGANPGRQQAAAAESGSVRLEAPARYSGGDVAQNEIASEDLPEPPLSDTELQAELDELATKKTAELEAKMRDEYEQQMEELQARLDEAEEERKRQEAEELARQQAEEEEARRKAAEEEAARKAEEERLAREAAEKAEAEAKTQPGDLVSGGPGVTTAVMTKKPSPVFPRMAQRMGRSAAVTVRVLVDHNGKVEEVQLAGDKAGFGFDEAALAAARNTEWKPAVKDGVNVKIWKSLRIVFDPSG